MGRPTTGDLARLLHEPLLEAFGALYGQLAISPLSEAASIPDGTTVLLIRDSNGRKRAVVLCSAPASPDMVARGMRRAREAKNVLDSSAGALILDPLLEGRANGLSYAVVPYCESLSDWKPLWWVQRALVRTPILDWLWRLTTSTVREVNNEVDRADFYGALTCMMSFKHAGDHLRRAAARALERLAAGTWVPKHVVMHGDLWKGNVLLKSAVDLTPLRWKNRLIVIDWAGSKIKGYAIYDLLRWAESARVGPRSLRKELTRHCAALQCSSEDAMCYLITALGDIALHLEYFPIEMYTRTAESCYSTLARCID